MLDEELSRLADKYRLPIMLCYLEGKSSAEAAQALSLNDNTLRFRLMRGRDLLRSRLVRRGVALSAGLLSTLLLENKSANASEVLIQSTIRAVRTAVPKIVGTTSGITAIELLKKLLVPMFYKKTMGAVIVAIAILSLGLLAGSWKWISSQSAKNSQVSSIAVSKKQSPFKNLGNENLN